MIRGIKFVSIPVKDQDAALSFYTEKLGFRIQTDQPFGPGQRWIELAIPGADSGLALIHSAWPRGAHRWIPADLFLV